MKKSELKQLISEVVKRKLAEAKGKKPVYGYVMKDADGFNPNDPTYQLIGYGNMPKSMWEKKLERYAEELLKRVKNKDWRNAAYFMEKNGVFNTAVNMMKELSDEELNEVDVSAIDTSAGETGLSDTDKKELANLKGQSDKLTSSIKKIEGDMAKMQTAIQPKMQRWERQKAKLQKQQSDVIRKQQSIQDKG